MTSNLRQSELHTDRGSSQHEAAILTTKPLCTVSGVSSLLSEKGMNIRKDNQRMNKDSGRRYHGIRYMRKRRHWEDDVDAGTASRATQIRAGRPENRSSILARVGFFSSTRPPTQLKQNDVSSRVKPAGTYNLPRTSIQYQE